MNCSLSCYPSARAWPSPCHLNVKPCSIPIASTSSQHHKQQKPTLKSHTHELHSPSLVQKTSLAGGFWPLKTPAVLGALLAAVEQPALAVTGVNNEEDFTWVLIQLGVLAFWYLLIMPPIILNWLRLRWYKRMLLEMYLQFMFVFMFFPGMLLWAPFVNFRRLPRDPTMKYPWSTPQDPSLTDSQTSP